MAKDPKFGNLPGPGPGLPKGKKKRSRELLDMMYVYRTNKPGTEFPSDTPGQATCRALLNNDPGKFMSMLNTMQKDYNASVEKGKRSDPSLAKGEADPVGGELQVLITRLLDEWEASDGSR